MSGGYLPHTPHYKVFAIKAASDIATSIIMKISDHYDLLAIILVSSIDLYNISPIKLILRVEVIVTRWIKNSETCLHGVIFMDQSNFMHNHFTVMEKCYFPHTSYVSVSNAYLTNILFPVTIITSGQFFAVGVHIILGFSEETNVRCHIGVTL